MRLAELIFEINFGIQVFEIGKELILVVQDRFWLFETGLVELKTLTGRRELNTSS